MMGRSHALSGATVWLLGTAAAHTLGAHPSVLGTAAGTIVCAGSALLPDIDHHSSKIARATSVVIGPIDVGVWSWGPWRIGPALAAARFSAWVHERSREPTERPNRSGHRAFTHTGLFALGVGSAVMQALLVASIWLPLLAGWSWLGAAVAAGCLTHTLGDSLTVSGVPLWWPARIDGCRWYAWGLRLIRTDHWGERRVVVPLLVLGAGVGAWFTIA
jgi:membrane-bound metal-dependent hydrolase YbcI (DUF457 family)